jgi:Flp pilus assembly pilin Flp
MIRRLHRDQRGVAMVELAFVAPVLLLLLLTMLDLANYARIRQQVSQLALQIADNSSRITSNNATGVLPITETQINDVLVGGSLQASGISIQTRGRIILSSLEKNDDGGQWLRWQRCAGALSHPSSWGVEGDGRTGRRFRGMGPSGSRMEAEEGEPVMFVEIAYSYRPLVTGRLTALDPFVETAAMPVRSDRSSEPITNGEGVAVSACG